MRKLIFSTLAFSSMGFSQDTSKDIPDRPPDIVSQPARLEDYYTKEGKWKDDIPKNKGLKGIVILGEVTVRYIPDPPKKKEEKKK